MSNLFVSSNQLEDYFSKIHDFIKLRYNDEVDGPFFVNGTAFYEFSSSGDGHIEVNYHYCFFHNDLVLFRRFDNRREFNNEARKILFDDFRIHLPFDLVNVREHGNRFNVSISYSPDIREGEYLFPEMNRY